MKFALIGEKLPHSYSREIFEQILGYPCYDLVELAPGEIESFLYDSDRDGINVTVPYKTAVVPYLDEISHLAKRIGAVNTIWRKDGKLCGTNTDYDGLKALLDRAGFDLKGKTVLILGTGGTSNTARVVCEDLGALEIYKVSRTGKNGALTYPEARMVPAHYIINTTPCGMYPKTEDSPMDLSPFVHPDTPDRTLLGVADVIYNPLHTAWMRQAKELGVPAVSGLYMLAAQAVSAECFFTGLDRDERERAERTGYVYRKLRNRKENLILVGMPASGKSTVGAELARMTGKCFYDTDTELTERIGSIPDYLRKNGEDAFRDEETLVIRTLTSDVRGCVIATGGGAVLREENRRLLAQNGYFIWLDRDPDNPGEDPGRPLSGTREKREALKRVREPIYRSVTDLTIRGFRTPEEACNMILKEMERCEF